MLLAEVDQVLLLVSLLDCSTALHPVSLLETLTYLQLIFLLILFLIVLHSVCSFSDFFIHLF